MYLYYMGKSYFHYNNYGKPIEFGFIGNVIFLTCWYVIVLLVGLAVISGFVFFVMAVVGIIMVSDYTVNDYIPYKQLPFCDEFKSELGPFWNSPLDPTKDFTGIRCQNRDPRDCNQDLMFCQGTLRSEFSFDKD